MLRKREALREVFGGFDPSYVVGMDVEPLLSDARLIRSRAKLEACVRNARAALEVDLPALVGEYAEVPSPAYASWEELPASTPRSAELAKRLKKTGFVFVGPTTVYSLLQACGYVGDHLTSCPAREEAERLRGAAFSS